MKYTVFNSLINVLIFVFSNNSSALFVNDIVPPIHSMKGSTQITGFGLTEIAIFVTFPSPTNNFLGNRVKYEYD